MEKFLNQKHLGVNFCDCGERDFFLEAIGYNDFHYIAPLKALRVQKFYTLHWNLLIFKKWHKENIPFAFWKLKWTEAFVMSMCIRKRQK